MKRFFIIVGIVMFFLFLNIGHLKGKVISYDTNSDGMDDQWGTYNDKDELDYVAIDSDHDGVKDIFKYYKDKILIRTEMDLSKDGKVDIWDFFENENLTRIYLSYIVNNTKLKKIIPNY